MARLHCEPCHSWLQCKNPAGIHPKSSQSIFFGVMEQSAEQSSSLAENSNVVLSTDTEASNVESWVLLGEEVPVVEAFGVADPFRAKSCVSTDKWSGATKVSNVKGLGSADKSKGV